MKEPLKIKGSIEYELEVTEEGYSIKVEPKAVDDLMCVLVARNIVERFQVDMRHAKSMKLSGKDKKFISERLGEMIETSYGLKIVSEQILRHLDNAVEK